MKFFEPIIIVVAIILVISPIISHFVKKKNGTHKCECGHYQNQCTGNCGSCSIMNGKAKGNGKMLLTYTIAIEGMKCGMCESHVSGIIRNEFNVIKVESSRKRKRVIIKSKEILNLSKLKEVLGNFGYEVKSISVN